MANTEKSRKGPSESATEHSFGTEMKGNDGNMWTISVTKSGIHRWTKISDIKPKQTTRKKLPLKTEEVTVEKLKQLKKKYKVEVSG
jgi:hypothetical protein